MDKAAIKERLLQHADNLRDLARRSRRLADSLGSESNRRCLQHHAGELDESAARLERQAIEARIRVFARMDWQSVG